MKPRINLAALGALNDGDVENFIIAAIPGGIEMQEAQGQQTLVNSSVLPKNCPRTQLEAMGVVFGSDVDDLFVNVTLPAGWAKQATEHHMWSDLLDDKGRKRADIFYKAAFYDRRANMHLVNRVTVTRRYGDDGQVNVVVLRGDEELFATEKIKRDPNERAYFTAIDAAEQVAIDWATKHYPDWRNPLAYWE